jgi:hypothetical protein
LNGGGGESGKIGYSTPGGGVGIAFYTGVTYDQNQFNIANYPTLGPGGTPVFHLGYTSAGISLAITKTTGSVGIGTASPTSKLQVVGLPVYATNAAAITGGLTAGAFYRTGADPDHICVVH